MKETRNVSPNFLWERRSLFNSFKPFCWGGRRFGHDWISYYYSHFGTCRLLVSNKNYCRPFEKKNSKYLFAALWKFNIP